jgi:MarR family 2-MHQ and catechol resistance regulon transcriptional repressor
MPRTAKTTLTGDAAALQAAVADLVRVYQFRDRDRIACHDISVTQCYALEMLVRKGPARLGELAQAMYLDKSTASRVVGALVRKGYVGQRTDSHDGRARTLHATSAGSRLHARIARELVEQQKALIEDFDPAVRRAVVDVIRGVTKAAEARFRRTCS